MTTIRDRLSRHRELLGSSKVVFLSPGVKLECVTSTVILSFVDSAVTLSASLSDDEHSGDERCMKCARNALIGARNFFFFKGEDMPFDMPAFSQVTVVNNTNNKSEI